MDEGVDQEEKETASTHVAENWGPGIVRLVSRGSSLYLQEEKWGMLRGLLNLVCVKAAAALFLQL